MPEFDSTIRYAPIPEINGQQFSGYMVGTDGSVWTSRCQGNAKTVKPWRELKQAVAHAGHKRVGLCRKSDGKQISLTVNWLVLRTFIGPCPEGMESCHFPDRNPANNNLENLRWGTRKENAGDRDKHGTTQRGEKHHLAKLTEADVIEIRQLSSDGQSSRYVAKKFGVTRTLVREIVKRRIWKHI